MGAPCLALTSALLLASAAASAEPRSSCLVLERSSQDKLDLAEAEAFFVECRALPLRAAWPLVEGLVLVAAFGLRVGRDEGTRWMLVASLLFAGVYVHLVVALVDWTGFALDGHGTSCFKAATCAAFGRLPAWLGPLVGLLLLAISCYQAFREEVREEKLRDSCRPVCDDDKETVLCVEVRKVRLERAKIAAKASASLGDVVLDACSLWSFMRQGQPSYVLLTLICIMRTEAGARHGITEAENDVLPRLWGWQADFIFLWRESLALAMASPAFLKRTVDEVKGETGWCSFVQFSALLSSTYSSWYPLATLFISTGMACLTVFFFGPTKEVTFAEGAFRHGSHDPLTRKFEVRHSAVRVIPLGDFYSRRRIRETRRMQLVAFYHVCEFLSKGIVTAALLHILKPVGLYVAGFLGAALLKPWQMRAGRGGELLDLFFWPIQYLKLASYPLTFPTSESWQRPRTSSPALTCTFLSLLWTLLLALNFDGAWLRQTWAGAVAGEFTATCAHHMVKLALLAAGLMAQLGLVGLAAALEQLRKGWYEEDAARLRVCLIPHVLNHLGFRLFGEGPRTVVLYSDVAQEGQDSGPREDGARQLLRQE